ncbi:hypothetical protein GCM10009798_30730 [Nocardioides panacihumi]|uniref:SHSP domain-containing protein n=1 Tax=Nocardioides panacihumi TaxID=400774 RepID=A0ABN2RFA1_9ACTN
MTITKRERSLPRTLERPWGLELFDSFTADRLRGLLTGESPFEWPFDGGSRWMRIETFTDGDETVVRAELPGLDPPKDIDISVEDDLLRISASREERSEDERPDGYHSEFRYGSFVRSLRLPNGVSEKDVRATYRDGILEVRVPHPPGPEAKEPHKVAVSRA